MSRRGIPTPTRNPARPASQRLTVTANEPYAMSQNNTSATFILRRVPKTGSLSFHHSYTLSMTKTNCVKITNRRSSLVTRQVRSQDFYTGGGGQQKLSAEDAEGWGLGWGVPLPNQLGGLGERRELPKRSPGRQPIFSIFEAHRTFLVKKVLLYGIMYKAQSVAFS